MSQETIKKEDEEVALSEFRLGGVRMFKASSDVQSLYCLISEGGLRKEVKLIFEKILALKNSKRKKEKSRGVGDSSSKNKKKKLH